MPLDNPRAYFSKSYSESSDSKPKAVMVAAKGKMAALLSRMMKAKLAGKLHKLHEEVNEEADRFDRESGTLHHDSPPELMGKEHEAEETEHEPKSEETEIHTSPVEEAISEEYEMGEEPEAGESKAHEASESDEEEATEHKGAEIPEEIYAESKDDKKGKGKAVAGKHMGAAMKKREAPADIAALIAHYSKLK
jgi:hypothetical protein